MSDSPSNSTDPSESSGDGGSVGGRINLAPGVFIAGDALRIQFTRSSGPGGQNVNKVNTRIEMWLPIGAIEGMSANALARLRRLAGWRMTAGDQLHLSAQTERSQERNRSAVMENLRELLIQAKTEPKPRRATKPSRAAKRRRLESKRRRGEIKSKRRSTSDD